jgi:membrane-associated protease RseP (regulator of RpoE activity)
MASLTFGVALVATGLAGVSGPAGLAVAAFGLVPIAAGVFNLCPIAPLRGGHFFGSQYCPARKATRSD